MWANSGWRESYDALWATEIGLGVRLVDGATNPEIVQVRLPVAGTGA